LVKPKNESGVSEIRQRRGFLIVVVIMFLLVFGMVFSQAAFNLTFLRPGNTQQTFVFIALSGLIFLLLVALGFVLLRNLLKLYSEYRGGVLGSMFRTKMLVGALLLSFAPVLFMFLFAYGLMNRSIDKWFSRPVEELREDSSRVAALLTDYASSNARAEAQSIAATELTKKSFETENFSGVLTAFKQHEPTLQGGFAVALYDGEAVAAFHMPAPWGTLRSHIPERIPENFVLRRGGTQYLIGESKVGPKGRILVATPLPASLEQTMRKIEDNQRMYEDMGRDRKQVRSVYMMFLLLITVVVLFFATWLSLFISKLVTRPVSALAEATKELSRGHFDYRIAVRASDELGELVNSFNRMAEELENSRKQIEASSRDLAQANTALEQRRQQIETILESIPSGVLSLDADQRILHSNRAFMALIQEPERKRTLQAVSGAALQDLFGAEAANELVPLLRKADRMSTTATQMELAGKSGPLNLAITVASVKISGQRLGYVMIFEDFTDLLRAQKQSAWQEVARRVAHEIKNPLTPIALSADRIRRHLERGSPPDEASLRIMHGCAETIAGAVETVRQLVDEFSTLARFPAARPQPSDINSIIEGALQMFHGRVDGIHIETALASRLPRVLADPEAIKRAIANLIDNAVEAMEDSLLRELHISTSLVESRDSVEVIVADTGHGVTSEMKEKLFLPYFSTKKRGTGLGLPIVSRIVHEHNGNIRVEENEPMGSRFIVELPIALEAAASAD
jgi:two-component system nitrogen regulation sensor histidine kinase NtrY